MSSEMFVYITCDYEGCDARTTGEWDRERYAAIDVDSEDLGWWSDPWREYDLCPEHSPWVKDKRYDYQKVKAEREYAERRRREKTEWAAGEERRRREVEARVAAFDRRQATFAEFLELWQQAGGGLTRGGP